MALLARGLGAGLPRGQRGGQQGMKSASPLGTAHSRAGELVSTREVTGVSKQALRRKVLLSCPQLRGRER